MGKKSSDAPTPPDPKVVAGAQTGTNVTTATANAHLGNVNQNTPYGNLSFDQTGSVTMTDPSSGLTYQVPQFTSTQTLAPDQQKLHNKQTQAEINLAQLAKDQSAKLGTILNSPLDLSGAPGVNAPQLGQVGNGPNLQSKVDDAGRITGRINPAGQITRSYGTDFSEDRRRVEEALYSRLNPHLEQGRSRLETQLANQGIRQGSAAYDRAMANQGQQENDARMGAILAGGQEQSRITGLEADRAAFENSAQGQKFGQNAARSAFWNDAQGQKLDRNMSLAAFGNATRQQEFANEMAGTGFNNQAAQQGFGNERTMRNDWLGEQYAARNQPINEIGALLGTGQVQSPQFMSGGGPQMPAVDYAGLVNNNYNQQMGLWNQQQQNNQNLYGGLFGMGAAGITAMSDRRLKTDVERVSMWKGLPLYLFRYIWGGPRRLGVMAQDVLKVKPEAVVHVGGFMAVDYGAL